MPASTEIPDRAAARIQAVSQAGLRRAGESLSGLLARPVCLTLSVPGAGPGLTVEAVSGAMAGLRVRFGGDLTGQIVILFPPSTVFRMLGVLMGRRTRPRALSETERSAIGEVGNILASSFLSGIADHLGLRLMPAPPELHLNDLSILIRAVTGDIEGSGSAVLAVESRIADPDRRIEGRLYFLPAATSLTEMLQAAPGAGGG